jgi:hypothetical protein
MLLIARWCFVTWVRTVGLSASCNILLYRALWTRFELYQGVPALSINLIDALLRNICLFD